MQSPGWVLESFGAEPGCGSGGFRCRYVRWGSGMFRCSRYWRRSSGSGSRSRPRCDNKHKKTQKNCQAVGDSTWVYLVSFRRGLFHRSFSTLWWFLPCRRGQKNIGKTVRICVGPGGCGSRYCEEETQGPGFWEEIELYWTPLWFGCQVAQSFQTCYFVGRFFF